MGFYEGKNVLVSGGAGFIGSHVVDALLEKGANVSVVTRKKNSIRSNSNLSNSIKQINILQADLKDYSSCEKIVKNQDFVFNYASSIGNMEYNRAHADIYRENVLIELNMLEASRKKEVDKYLVMSSAFVYPEGITRPLKEEDSLLGEPSESKFGYGSSKRANELAAQAYAKQYGMKIAIVRPSNVYGTRDNFFSDRGLVIPVFIERAFSGKNIIVAGDGSQIRNFIYVKDCVEGMLLTLEKKPIAEPFNLATKEQTTIKQLAEMVSSLVRGKSEIIYDKSLSIGPKMIVPDCSKAEKLMGFIAKTTLNEGLEKTVSWFKENKN